jgi:NAD(P)-dependent dehydrogenase (short-subunit alcohol dehydrogenase family)
MPSAQDVSDIKHHPFRRRNLLILLSVTNTALTSSLMASGPEFRQQIESVQPLKGIGCPEDVARIAVVLASEDVAWVTGTAIAVDGGFLCQ